MNQSVNKFVLILMMMFVIITSVIQANDANQPPHLGYYLSGDENDVQQVFQKLLTDDSEARQITHSATNVTKFGIAYDGLGIVYIADSQLWLQPIHTEEAELLATLNGYEFWTNPIFSQDGNYVAYEDNGVWLYDLVNRQTRQILEDVPLAEMATNANEYRLFKPQRFIVNGDGTVTKLLVDIGVWEWNTAGIYDLASDELLELEGQIHSDVLALYDGQALVFGNSGVSGESSLHLADNLAEINSANLQVLFHELTEATLFAEQARELEPGIVRVFGQGVTLSAGPVEPTHFYLDFDLNKGELVGEVQLMNLRETKDGQEMYADTAPWSSDGSLIPVYVNPRFGDAGVIYGELMLLNIETGAMTGLNVPEVVSGFQFQP